MILKFGKRYKLDDLNSIGISGSDNRDERSKIKIAIIDDEDIPFLNSLRNSGYNIQHYRDVDNFNMLSDYQIVISDIDGVGQSFSSEYQGAYIIKELKRLFPDKYLIAMSSKIYNLSFTEILSNADVKINRDVNVDIVSEKLNLAIKEISSVKNRWLRVRAQLINEHFIDLYDVWSMEQDVIKSILIKENKIDSDKLVKLFGSVVSGIVVNFISGVIS